MMGYIAKFMFMKMMLWSWVVSEKYLEPLWTEMRASEISPEFMTRLRPLIFGPSGLKYHNTVYRESV